jgi:CubicO group peptidase (beta-lactamase class C family)
VFRDDSVGRYWTEHNLSEEQYGSVLDENKNKGFYPTCIQGSVIGQDTRYAVIFGQNDRPRPYDRKWTVTGQDNPSLAGIDEIIKNFMQQNGIRAGVLAIKGKKGDIKLLHGYTWAEHDVGYPITQPNSLFRIASVSKMFTCAAIQKLYDDKLLYPSTKVFPTLSISSPAIEGQKPDDRINDIEVQHLVAHRGGWINGQRLSDPEIQIPFAEPVFGIRNIARRLNLQRPLTKTDFARYMYGQKLHFTPGVQPEGSNTYSNFGYVLLGMLVEKVDRKNRIFIDFLREEVLAPINITDVSLARTSYSSRADNEVFYDDPGLGPSVVDQPGAVGWYADTNEYVPYPYGGAGFSTEIMDSGGGLMSTAEALVQFASRYPVDSIGKERLSRHAQRDGAMPGTNSLVVSRGDGSDYAFIFNRLGPGRDGLTQKIDEFLHNKEI